MEPLNRVGYEKQAKDSREKMGVEPVYSFISNYIKILQRKDASEDDIKRQLEATWLLFKDLKLRDELLIRPEYKHEVAILMGLNPDAPDIDDLIKSEVANMDMEKWNDDILKYYDNYHERSIIFLKKIEPKLRAITADIINKNIDNGYLPLSKEEVKHSIQLLMCGTRDPFYVGTGNFEETSFSVRIVIYSTFPLIVDYDEDNLDELVEEHLPIYCHEVIHALSGITAKMEIIEPEDEELYRELDTPQEIIVERSGLSTRGNPKWLNEGITEHITQSLLGQISANSVENNSYTGEQELVALIAKITDISEKEFTDAYFENSDPNSDKYPKYILLMEKINKTLREQTGISLNAIDKMVKKDGIYPTIDYLKSITK